MSDKQVLFRVVRINPDRRQWMQQTVETVPFRDLFVSVPMDAEEKTNGGDADVITVEELKRVMDRFDSIFAGAVEVEQPTEALWEEVSEEDDWGKMPVEESE